MVSSLRAFRLATALLAPGVTVSASNRVPALRKRNTHQCPHIAAVDDLFENYPSGPATFANIPYVNCFSADSTAKAEYDIAILGAPFDTGVTGRPGARFGPQGIRAGSWRIYPEYAWSVYAGRNPFKDWARIVDCGDAPLTWLDNSIALAALERAHLLVSGRPAKSASNMKGSIPRIITLGGDHTTTLPALRAAFQRWGELSVVHFDAHIDTWDPKVLGGESRYAGTNHGTFLHIAHEEGLISNNSIHAGIRAPVSRPKEDMENDRRCGFSTITARDLDKLGTSGVIQAIRDRVGSSRVYISVDIDVLDPAYAPATGTAEPGGWTTREFLTILDGLVGLKVVGADVVEVAPVYDNVGEITVLVASEVVQSLLDLMVQVPVE
ncbi:arginase family protein [Canariomyces notabilis]|uniref:Arginase family protein n=1 Tax=Canariomyces notabilis TaxID=2074819 RepID=A0AAN6TAT8_9PEZI|nr:arginase family protein [Canariomyces arenarius]